MLDIEISALRQGMWTSVASRTHSVPKIFPFGNNANQFMLYGNVVLGLKNGAESELEWAGRAEVVKSSTDGMWRMKFYQVYLVRPLSNLGSFSKVRQTNLVDRIRARLQRIRSRGRPRREALLRPVHVLCDKSIQRFR